MNASNAKRAGCAALQRKIIVDKRLGGGGGGGETKDSNGCSLKAIRVWAAHVRSG